MIAIDASKDATIASIVIDATIYAYIPSTDVAIDAIDASKDATIALIYATIALIDSIDASIVASK